MDLLKKKGWPQMWKLREFEKLSKSQEKLMEI